MPNYRYWASTLTGGAEGSLDSIDGDDVNDGDTASVPVSDDKIYEYYLDADSALAENSPNVISPDSNAGDKRWILIPPYVQGVMIFTLIDWMLNTVLSPTITSTVTWS